jgi:hypothetical protein
VFAKKKGGERSPQKLTINGRPLGNDLCKQETIIQGTKLVVLAHLKYAKVGVVHQANLLAQAHHQRTHKGGWRDSKNKPRAIKKKHGHIRPTKRYVGHGALRARKRAKFQIRNGKKKPGK